MADDNCRVYLLNCTTVTEAFFCVCRIKEFAKEYGTITVPEVYDRGGEIEDVPYMMAAQYGWTSSDWESKAGVLKYDAKSLAPYIELPLPRKFVDHQTLSELKLPKNRKDE